MNNTRLLLSLIIPTLNEEENILRCLNSIGKQTYPHNNIEILIADAGSTDNTLALLEKWKKENNITLHLIHNEKLIAEFGKAKAIRAAKGDIFCLLDCDEELVQSDALDCYVKAFHIFPDIVGVEPYFLKIPGGSIINNYMAVTHYTDPMGETIAVRPHIVETKENDGKTYRKLEFGQAYGCMLFLKREHVEPFMNEDQFHEGSIMPKLASQNHNKMCMIDGYGVRHHHVTSLQSFLRKRWKIALKFTTRSNRTKTWVSYTPKNLYLHAFLNLTLVYELARSILKAIKHKEPLWLYHSPMCFLSTATYIISLVYIKLSGRRAW
ncbi:MAG: glycosyltransferase [Kiritimatiellae bacterium]|nr:glycosyltransferase [Kiritimatiellia bacterium]